MGDQYDEIRKHFAGVDGITVSSGRGAQGIKFGTKMFVMFYKGQLLVKLPPERVAELIASGHGLPHDPGTGKPMRDRVLLPESRKTSWIGLCEESRRFHGSD